MIPYPNISPEIFKIGPLAVRWYGMMYLLGFLASYLLIRLQIKEKGLAFGADFVESLFSYLILGLLFGARLGYVIFYNPGYYLNHPLEIFAVWQGGMSFHGGLIGTIAAGFLFSRKTFADFWLLSDLIAATAPIGIGLGRLGNFINSELYGRVTDVAWAMVFPSGGPLPRHPSQLYELFLEGFLLFGIMWFLKGRKFGSGVVSGLFLVFYGVFRFFVEFFREPDAQIGFILGFLTMGQILCGAMITAGLVIVRLRGRKSGG
ncbi:MAG: prolipoprotein diacylglyceryl transferase [Nitrospirae bacterium]|nr:MAG: prolipoprotein diacylglyceryl transferase [Nitrospirota bacterium]